MSGTYGLALGRIQAPSGAWMLSQTTLPPAGSDLLPDGFGHVLELFLSSPVLLPPVSRIAVADESLASHLRCEKTGWYATHSPQMLELFTTLRYAWRRKHLRLPLRNSIIIPRALVDMSCGQIFRTKATSPARSEAEIPHRS